MPSRPPASRAAAALRQFAYERSSFYRRFPHGWHDYRAGTGPAVPS